VSALRLRIRTPAGLALDSEVSAIRAEDEDGWFGILPGRRDIVAVLPPGLLLFTDADGEGYAAVSGGLLDLSGPECRVMVREARVAREARRAADALESLLATRRERSERRRSVMRDLEREALRRLSRSVREARW